jgi:fatty acid amide hydrolase 2
MAAILEAAEAPLPRRNAWLYALRGRGDHTIPMLLLLSVEKLADRAPERRTRRAIAAGRSLREEVAATLDGGVLLHPPFAKVAPRHGRTVGRPWTILPAAIFNLLGTPVTQVPLGLNEAGLPLGVQVAACDGADHVTIAVALELERVFGGWVPPPYVPAETPTAVAA